MLHVVQIKLVIERPDQYDEIIILLVKNIIPIDRKLHFMIALKISRHTLISWGQLL